MTQPGANCHQPPIRPAPASQPADNQTGPLQVNPGRRADLFGTGQRLPYAISSDLTWPGHVLVGLGHVIEGR